MRRRSQGADAGQTEQTADKRLRAAAPCASVAMDWTHICPPGLAHGRCSVPQLPLARRAEGAGAQPRLAAFAELDREGGADWRHEVKVDELQNTTNKGQASELWISFLEDRPASHLQK